MAELKKEGAASPHLHDQLVTPERSVFGTRLPRPTGVGRHLVIVIVLSLIALLMAIAFAERKSDVSAPGGQNDEGKGRQIQRFDPSKESR